MRVEESQKTRRPSCATGKRIQNATQTSRTTHRSLRTVPTRPVQQQREPKTPAARRVRGKEIRNDEVATRYNDQDSQNARQPHGNDVKRAKTAAAICQQNARIEHDKVRARA